MNNKARKLRRTAKNKDNAKNPATKKLTFNQKEQMIIGEIKTLGGQVKSNSDAIVGLNVSLGDLNQNVTSFGNFMNNYDQQSVQPIFNSLLDKINLLVDIILDNIENIDLDEEQMKILDLTFEEDEETEEDEIIEKEVEKMSDEVVDEKLNDAIEKYKKKKSIPKVPPSKSKKTKKKKVIKDE